ncbi:immunity 52 family protein [Agromyces soli]|uniref:Immunity 52 family protein n=1 Tax=Agromyces soli TaxID=659012 RepID=A0ABY4AWZ7_9MICO|nr:immunity 52 family protein [Agromyces soli]UOE27530.1 immunity 52 family protein [Agromyces soli]
MSVESSFLGAYWGGRVESSAEIAERLASCLAGMAGLHPALRTWFQRGGSRKSAKTPIDVSEASLTALLERGRNRDDDGAIIEDLGFSFGAWNGTRPAIGLSLTAGADPSTPSVLNSFVLNLPELDASSAGLYSLDVGQALMKAVVEAWAPSWATWATHELHVAQSPAPREPAIGWLTYLQRASDAPALGFGERVGEGVLFASANSIADVDAADVVELRARLRALGMLAPIPFVR